MLAPVQRMSAKRGPTETPADGTEPESLGAFLARWSDELGDTSLMLEKARGPVDVAYHLSCFAASSEMLDAIDPEAVHGLLFLLSQTLQEVHDVLETASRELSDRKPVAPAGQTRQRHKKGA